MINAILSQFIEATPVTVMVRGIMERIFEPTALDELFETHRSTARLLQQHQQYKRSP